MTTEARILHRPGAVRGMAVHYFLRDLVWGMFLPYYPLALASEGVDHAAVTRIVLIFPVAQVMVAPLTGVLSERLARDGHVIRLASGLSMAVFPVYFVVHSGTGHVVATIVFAAFYMAAGAMCEILTVRVASFYNSQYGAIRMWGAAGFCLSASLGGEIIARLGVKSIFFLCFAVLVLAFLQSLRLVDPPRARPAAPGLDRRRTARAPISGLWAFFAAIALYSVAHGCYVSGFSLYYHGLGASVTLLGLAWGTAQVSEIVAFALSGRVVARVGARRLLELVFVAAICRWALLAVLESPAAILATQILHALTFGLFQPAMVVEACRLGRATNSSLGWVYGFFASGQVIGMYFTGALLQNSAFALFATASITAFAALGVLRLHRHNGAPPATGRDSGAKTSIS